MKNQKGFALIQFCLFLPLLLVALFSVAWVCWFIIQNNRLSNLCQHYNLKAQNHLVTNNNSLISLNDKAWELHLEKKALQELIRTTPPQGRLMLQIRLQQIIRKQIVLKGRQKFYIHRGKIMSRQQAFQLKNKLRSKARSIGKLWQIQPKAAQLSLTWRTSQLIPVFNDIAPAYKRPLDHSQKQRLVALWSIDIHSVMPQWISHWLPARGFAKGSCYSHPHKGVQKWIAAIGKGNH